MEVIAYYRVDKMKILNSVGKYICNMHNKILYENIEECCIVNCYQDTVDHVHRGHVYGHVN